MTPASISSGRQHAGNALLVVGYAVAVWTLAKAVPMFRRRQTRRFLAAEAATTGVAIGWAVRGKSVPSVLNAGMVAMLAAAWWIGGRRRS